MEAHANFILKKLVAISFWWRFSVFFLSVDECALYGQFVCRHKCINTVGSYRCGCNYGWQLARDGYSCYYGMVWSYWPMGMKAWYLWALSTSSDIIFDPKKTVLLQSSSFCGMLSELDWVYSQYMDLSPVGKFDCFGTLHKYSNHRCLHFVLFTLQ